MTNKGHKRKRQVSEIEGDEVTVTTATDKSCKKRRQNPKIQDNPDCFNFIMNYFDKHLERIDKKLQQQSNKNAKMEDIFKFKHKETEYSLTLAKKFYKSLKIFDQR